MISYWQLYSNQYSSFAHKYKSRGLNHVNFVYVVLFISLYSVVIVFISFRIYPINCYKSLGFEMEILKIDYNKV